jgi:NADH dehydrogenase
MFNNGDRISGKLDHMAAVKRILVTGGGTILGDAIAAALLAEGAEVTLLVRPGAEKNLGGLAQRVRWFSADVWEPSSLKGRARGNQVVIHTVGSMKADPSRGLSYQHLNFLSARNVANMCVSGGVGQMVLLSAPRAPWIPSDYVRAKRDAEAYLLRIGLKATIIRAPLAYVRGERRSAFYQLLSLMGHLPPISWLGMRRVAPMPIDVLARGIARITLAPKQMKTVYFAGDLRRHNTSREIRRGLTGDKHGLLSARDAVQPIDLMDEDTPFGWTPPAGD